MEIKTGKDDATQIEVIKRDLGEVGHRFTDVLSRIKTIGNKISSTPEPDGENDVKVEIKDSPGHITDLRTMTAQFHKLATNFESVISKIEKFI